MQSIFVVVLVGIVAGFAVGVQAPMASLISGRLGTLEGVFIVHLGGTIAAAIPLLALGGGNLKSWREVPPYMLIAGFFGLVVISGLSYTIPRSGATATIFLILIGQLVIGATIDHYGWLDTDVRPFEFTRALGVVVMFVGVWLMLR
jgi:transporter family-2 protein